MADKRTMVTTNHECEIVTIKGEQMLKIKMTGISYKNYAGSKTTFADVNKLELYLPLYSIPYLLRKQRETIAKWEKEQLDFIKRIKDGFMQEVKIPETK